MKKSRFSEKQIVGVLKEAEAGVPVKELCRRVGISDATFYHSKAKYGGLEVNEARRLRQLEDENGRLKKIVVQQALDLDAIWQTSIPPGHVRHEIRQNVRAKDSLELSFDRAIYESAGSPQGVYSCLIRTDVRYRLGDEWFNQTLDIFKVEMTGLKARRLRRPRWYERRV